MMQCVICKRGETKPGHTDVVLQQDSAVIIIRDVPAEVCCDCDEYYLAEPVALEVSRIADEALERGVEVEILRYAA